MIGKNVVDGPALGPAVFTGVKVFTATKARDREDLGEAITRWLKDNPRLLPIDRVVVQSSDREFHCLTIVIFYRELTTPA